jgi:hypothetical protein
LERLARHFVPALISETGLNGLREIAVRIPPELNPRLFGLEVPLGRDEREADLLVHVGKRDQAWNQLIRADVPGEKSWHAARAMAAGSDAQIDDLWLEFDRSRPANPSLFWKPGDGRRQLLSTLAAVRDTLGPEVLTYRDLVAARACGRAHTPDSRVFQMGLMLGRRPATLRMCVRGLATPSQRRSFLRRASWKGTIDELETALATFGSGFDEVALVVDANGGAGLECYVTECRRAARADRWGKVLSNATREALCTVSERDALLACPGAEPLGRGRLVELEARSIHHVKLSASSGMPVRLKAYLAVDRLLWVRRSSR